MSEKQMIQNGCETVDDICHEDYLWVLTKSATDRIPDSRQHSGVGEFLDPLRVECRLWLISCHLGYCRFARKSWILFFMSPKTELDRDRDPWLLPLVPTNYLDTPKKHHVIDTCWVQLQLYLTDESTYLRPELERVDDVEVGRPHWLTSQPVQHNASNWNGLTWQPNINM